MFGRVLKNSAAVLGTRPNISEFHSEIRNRVPFCFAVRRFTGQIKERHCKQCLPVPSDWPSRAKKVCTRSAQKPDVWLQLEHVFGYNGAPNSAS